MGKGDRADTGRGGKISFGHNVLARHSEWGKETGQTQEEVGRFHLVIMYLQGTVKGERRQGRHRKRWEENRGRTGLEFAKSQRAVENWGKTMEETGYKIICGAPTTLAVKE